MNGFCYGNATSAAREYRARFSNRASNPDCMVFRNIHRIYVDGQIPSNVREKGRARVDIGKDAINDMVTENPNISIRRISINTFGNRFIAF